MSIGIWQIAIVVILVVLLFGRGKISSLMGDVAKGIKSFKKGMASDVTEDSDPKNISDENQDTSDENQDSSDENQDSNKKE
jgi:sec-independent protein translocase protein TatA